MSNADTRLANTRRTQDDPRLSAAVADEILFTMTGSSLGGVMVARSARGVCAVLLGNDPIALAEDLQKRFPRATLREDAIALRALAAEVAAFVDSPARPLDVPLDLRGTEFQRTVWQALREIAAGETTSYAEIAKRIGRPRSVRAVGGACAANPLAVIVPCHRVLRSDGGLSGYRWGIEWKRNLLAIEAA